MPQPARRVGRAGCRRGPAANGMDQGLTAAEVADRNRGPW